MIIQCKPLFAETLSPKNHVQVSFDNKCYQYAVQVSFTATLPTVTTHIHTGKKMSSLASSKKRRFATKLFSSFGFTYQKISDFEMKGGQ